MFGVIHACQHTLDDELLAQWRSHLCGLCLSLRDSRGQLSRALTNTDAVMLSVLVEAQQDTVAARSTAGPCPLRGMRTARVVPADAVAARLGATASLTLAAAKAGDVRAERDHQLAPWSLRNRAVGAMAGPLRRGALADSPMASTVDVLDVLDDLSAQGELESRIRPGDSVLTATAPTARAAGRIFAASAEVAGRPENVPALREIGEAFGTLAHLIDAVEDLDADRRNGAFNPIIATGTPLSTVRRECTSLVRKIRSSFGSLILSDGRLVRALLVDGTHTAMHRAFGSTTSTTCATPAGRADAVDLGYPGQQPPAPPGGPPEPPPDAPPDWPGSADPAAPQWPGPPGPDSPPPPKDPPRPPFWPSVLPWIGVYCTGYACCASHQNPCTGRQHSAGCSGADGGCCDCCDCCDCDDGCCCDCNC